MTNKTEFAKVVWRVGDIEALCPTWSLEKCEKWLMENEKYIQEGLIDFGWKIIENLLKQ